MYPGRVNLSSRNLNKLTKGQAVWVKSEIHTESRASSPVGNPGTPLQTAKQDPSHENVTREEPRYQDAGNFVPTLET